MKKSGLNYIGYIGAATFAVMFFASTSPSMANANCGCKIPEYIDVLRANQESKGTDIKYSLTRKCRRTCKANKKHRCIVDRATTTYNSKGEVTRVRNHRKKLNCSSGANASANAVWKSIPRDDINFVAVFGTDALGLVLDPDLSPLVLDPDLSPTMSFISSPTMSFISE